MPPKRCVCGRSRSFPTCDGSHGARPDGGAVWTCLPASAAFAEQGFLAGRANHNLAERLAFEFGGIPVHSTREPIEVGRLVVLTEGYDLPELEAALSRIRARDRVVWGLGEASAVVAEAFSGWTYVAIEDGGRSLWEELCRAARGELSPARPVRLRRAFLSHAVADEGRLMPVVDRLRRTHQADVFVCADSIAAGAAWEPSIWRELTQRPTFLFAISKASVASVSCAFEAGAARALQKEIALVSLDGVTPPAFLQHLQSIDVPRRMAARPWLDAESALTAALLEAMAETSAAR